MCSRRARRPPEAGRRSPSPPGSIPTRASCHLAVGDLVDHLAQAGRPRADRAARRRRPALWAAHQPLHRGDRPGGGELAPSRLFAPAGSTTAARCANSSPTPMSSWRRGVRRWRRSPAPSRRSPRHRAAISASSPAIPSRWRTRPISAGCSRRRPSIHPAPSSRTSAEPCPAADANRDCGNDYSICTISGSYETFILTFVQHC